MNGTAMQNVTDDHQFGGFTIWFTGLPSSGKTTLSGKVAEALRNAGYRVEVLDGDELRRELSKDLGFSKADRDTHILRIGYIAKLLSRNGVIAIVAAISPYRETRERVRKEIGRFVEVYVKCPVEVCAQRDTKGLYAKARRGEIDCFTGVSDPYEEPTRADLLLETAKMNVMQCVLSILFRLRELEAISASVSIVHSDE